MFRAGQMVKCVGNGGTYIRLLNRHPDVCPVAGNVYFVERLRFGDGHAGLRCLVLEEIDFWLGYPCHWFQPCAPVDFDKFMRRIFDQQERPFA